MHFELGKHLLSLLMFVTVQTNLIFAQSFEAEYKGAIGIYEIEMNLNAKDGDLSGDYKYDGKKTKLKLLGYINGNQVTIREYNSKAALIGTFEGVLLSNDKIKGEWKKADGSTTYPFFLNPTKHIQSESSMTVAVPELNQGQTDASAERKMLQPSKVKGFSKLALWTTIGLIISVGLLGYYFSIVRKKYKVTKEELKNTSREKPQYVVLEGDSAKDVLKSVNLEKGQKFQAYMVKYADKNKYLSFYDSTRDLDVEGISPLSNKNPDLVFQYKDKTNNLYFSVECKWKRKFENDKVRWTSTKKIEEYREYEKREGKKVFVALGIGWTNDSPEELYIIPLSEINGETLHRKDIIMFRTEREFPYFDPEKNTLS